MTLPLTLVVTSQPIAGLIPYAENARTHSTAQVAQIAPSIAEFGFVNPVLVDAEGVLIAGHGRVMAAKKLGMATVPVLRLGHLSPEQVRALRLADNQIALNSGWDEKLLAGELALIRDEGIVDLDVLGFSSSEIDKLLAAAAGDSGEDDDLVPPVPEQPVSKPGDVWQLGRHRIICGSSTDALDVARLLAGVKPHLMVTDPPYGVNYDPAWRVAAKAPDGRRLSKGNVSMGAVDNDDRADWREAWDLFPGDVAYVWHGGLHAAAVAESLMASGFVMRSQIIWAKQQLVIGRGDYHWQHEPCWYAVRKGKTGHYVGDRKQRSVWEIANAAGKSPADDGATAHSTQKPVECMRRPIENNSSHGQAVYDPFSGSGTTIIAAETTGRVCYAVELNPAYVDMAVLRWQAFTGLQATLDGEDRTFAEIAAARGVPAAA